MGRLGAKAVAYARVLPRARRNRLDFVRHLWRRPWLLAGNLSYESGLFLSSRVGSHLKALAQLRTSSLIGCYF